MGFKLRSPEEAPPPEPQGRGQRVYPWPQMEIGQSFEVEVEEGEDFDKKKAGIQSAGYNWCRRNTSGENSRTVRVRANKEQGTIEVWMVERAEPWPEETEGSSEEGENDGEELPRNFPGRGALRKAGITTMEDLREGVASEEINLAEILGEEKAAKAQKRLGVSA